MLPIRHRTSHGVLFLVYNRLKNDLRITFFGRRARYDGHYQTIIIARSWWWLRPIKGTHISRWQSALDGCRCAETRGLDAIDLIGIMIGSLRCERCILHIKCDASDAHMRFAACSMRLSCKYMLVVVFVVLAVAAKELKPPIAIYAPGFFSDSDKAHTHLASRLWCSPRRIDISSRATWHRKIAQMCSERLNVWKRIPFD